MSDPSHTEASARRASSPVWTGEKAAWWIVFSTLVVSIVIMLGLWN